MDQILKDHNSSVNQDIKGKLVNREIFCCFSYEMTEMLKAPSYGVDISSIDLPTYEDIENYYSLPKYSGYYSDKLDIAEGGDLLYYTAMYDKIDAITDCLQSDYDEIKNLEEEEAEIYEWYAVTDWFARKLKEQGECILEYGCNSYWGRQTSGQAILLDFVIAKIAYGMEILNGQENSWAENK